MKRVTVVYDNGNSSVFQCSSASWGDQSRNLIMRGVASETPGAGHKPAVPFVILPLAGVHFFMEEEW